MTDDLDEQEFSSDPEDMELDGDLWEHEEFDKPTKNETYHETAEQQERVILVGVSQPQSQKKHETDEHIDELEMLVDTAGGAVVARLFQSRNSISVSTFIGKGKVETLAELCEEQEANTVVFDDDLTPVQQRNLEKALNRKVLDRTALILDIFALHAQTKEAKTQVELAQLEYMLPRLTRMWTHLSKQYGGIGTKGPGETQIETDRRLVRDRISGLKKKLEKIDQQRETQRKSRKHETHVALVGYTNVGKSTLMNMMTDAGVLAENQLFATLDSTVRAHELNNHTLLFSDTVGFIRKLPTKLVASFKSTLMEVTEADIILHVIDITHPQYEQQMSVVKHTLKELGADDKPTILVFNKIDGLESMDIVRRLRATYANAVFISAARGMNISELEAALLNILDQKVIRVKLSISPPDFKLIGELHTNSNLISEEYEEDSIAVECDIEPAELDRLKKHYKGALTVVE